VSERSEDAPTPVDPRIAAAVVDVFVYVVVLNLFVEYVPTVIKIVVATKKRVAARFRAAETPGGKVVAGVLLRLEPGGSRACAALT
jgi:hypothetical protein